MNGRERPERWKIQEVVNKRKILKFRSIPFVLFFDKHFQFLGYILGCRKQFLVGFGQFGREAVCCHTDRHGRSYEGIFHNRPAFGFANNDTNSRILMWQLNLLFQYIEIKLHLPFALRLELSDFQLNGYHCLQATVVKQQIYKILPAVHLQLY